MALDVKQEVLENIVQVLHEVTGEKVQEGMDCLARLVKENEGNDIMERFTDNCKRMQTSYNDYFVPAVTALLDEYATMEEFRSVIAKAASNMSDVKLGSTNIQADKIEMPEI